MHAGYFRHITEGNRPKPVNSHGKLPIAITCCTLQHNSVLMCNFNFFIKILSQNCDSVSL